MQKLMFPITMAWFVVPFFYQFQRDSEPALPLPKGPDMGNEYPDGPKRPNPDMLSRKILEAAVFCVENGLNTDVAILIDLGLHSGSYRCWVVRFSDGATCLNGLVTHGSGTGKGGLGVGERKYSNVGGSLLSSLGKYRTGFPYRGQFGLAYKLHGLEQSNSNAFSRAIVLHGLNCVPDSETPYTLCQSWGCPSVSPAFLLQLAQIIDSSKKPILLWVFDSRHSEN